MSRKSFGSLFGRGYGSGPSWRQCRLAVEPLEQRAMLTTLTVDINDPTANDPGDKLYAEIQEAVDAASPGDHIKVHTGTYMPFVVNTDNLTVREAKANSNPVVDGDLNPGDENGVEVHADRVTIKGLTVQNASRFGLSETGNGFLVTGDHNTFGDNIASQNESNGFRLQGADNNRLTGNIATDSNGLGLRHGFSLEESNGNLLTRNKANDNPGGSGGFGLFNSDGNALRGNAASHNGRDGFLLRHSNDNEVTANHANSNGVMGFWLESSHGNSLVRNISRANTQDGFILDGGHSNNLSGNSASNNELSGFVLIASDGNFLRGNWASGSNVGFRLLITGLFAPDGIASGNTLIYNTAAENNVGFSFTLGNDNTLIGNRATDNAMSGFRLMGSNGNTMRGNWAVRNGEDGFRLEFSDDNVLERNWALHNLGSGFVVIELPSAGGSDDNLLKGNKSLLNDGWGFLVDDVLSNSFEDNLCLLNGLGDSNQPGIC